MAWLVTGGAGYIGSHVVRAFLAEGMEVLVVDDLSSGHEEFVPSTVPFYRGTILDGELLERIFREHSVSGVVHVAGFKYAGVSVQRPLHTYEQNVTATAVLLAAMQEAGVDAIVFSSSAAVYGTPDVETVTEQTPKSPESPYGESKLIGEWLLRDQGVAAGLRHTSLRYFNVVGSGDPSLRDTSPHNLFPLVFDALVAGRTPRINGDDYPTPDGTCVRDYIHVADLAEAHLLALKAATSGEHLICNLGNGEGFSVRQVIETVRQVTGHPIPEVVAPRRGGDPAVLVASARAAREKLGWNPSRADLAGIVADAWEFAQNISREQ